VLLSDKLLGDFFGISCGFSIEPARSFSLGILSPADGLIGLRSSFMSLKLPLSLGILKLQIFYSIEQFIATSL
jgi:hypothetical protein